eukprot:360130-Chlamydomonas_euryale.AAC.2
MRGFGALSSGLICSSSWIADPLVTPVAACARRRRAGVWDARAASAAAPGSRSPWPHRSPHAQVVEWWPRCGGVEVCAAAAAAPRRCDAVLFGLRALSAGST